MCVNTTTNVVNAVLYHQPSSKHTFVNTPDNLGIKKNLNLRH